MGDAVEVVFATVGAGAPEVGVGAGVGEQRRAVIFGVGPAPQVGQLV